MTNPIPVTGSLRNRLALILTGGAALLAVVFFLVVRTYAAQIAQAGQDNILGASASSILDAAVLRDGVVEVDFPYAAFSMLNTPSDDRVFYAIFQDGELLSGYENLIDPNTASTQRQFATTTYEAAEVRVVSANRTLIGAEVPTRITVSVAQTNDALSVTLNVISRNVALIGAGFFVLTSLLSLWATSSTVGQLRGLATSVTKRGPHDLRPFTQAVPSEMTPLVGSLNSLMGRLDQSLKQSEDFITEAAHRIRTPLATVRSHAEATFQRVQNADNRHALRSMMRAIDESSRAAGQLLDHAMITFRADILAPEALDIADILGELVRSLGPLADLKDITLRLSTPDIIPFKGDPILLENAFRNLIDNALKYAPPDSIVHVRSTANPVIVTIEDEGEGFRPAEIETLAGRFVRGTTTIESVGSGLGLTIVQDVTMAHGGTMTLTNRTEGGACVTLRF